MLIEKMKPPYEIESAIEIMKRNDLQNIGLNEVTILLNLFEIIPILDIIPKSVRTNVKSQRCYKYLN